MAGTMEILWIRLFRSDNRSLDHFFFWEACSCFSVEMKLASAMLTISDEAEGLLNPIFRHVFISISHVLMWCELAMRCELTIWSCAVYAPKLGQTPIFTLHHIPFQYMRLSSDSQFYSRKGHCHFESSKKKHPTPCSAMIILNAITWIIAPLKLDLNPIHPAFHKHSFPTRSHHDSDPQEISTLISWVSAEISTASPFCKAGIFVSSSWVLHRMRPMCPWVQNRLGWNILGSRAQFLLDFNWLLFTWNKPGNLSLRAAAI